MRKKPKKHDVSRRAVQADDMPGSPAGNPAGKAPRTIVGLDDSDVEASPAGKSKQSTASAGKAKPVPKVTFAALASKPSLESQQADARLALEVSRLGVASQKRVAQLLQFLRSPEHRVWVSVVRPLLRKLKCRELLGIAHAAYQASEKANPDLRHPLHMQISRSLQSKLQGQELEMLTTRQQAQAALSMATEVKASVESVADQVIGLRDEVATNKAQLESFGNTMSQVAGDVRTLVERQSTPYQPAPPPPLNPYPPSSFYSGYHQYPVYPVAPSMPPPSMPPPMASAPVHGIVPPSSTLAGGYPVEQEVSSDSGGGEPSLDEDDARHILRRVPPASAFAPTPDSRNKVAKPPVFTGERDGPSIEDALYVFQVYLEGNSIPRASWVNHVVSLLAGKAQSQWVAEAMRLPHPITWETFCSIMTLNFSHPDRALLARKRIHELQQGTRSFDAYVRDFRHLLNVAGPPKLSDLDLILHLSRGMDPALFDKCRVDPVSRKHWTDFEAFLRFCTTQAQSARTDTRTFTMSRTKARPAKKLLTLARGTDGRGVRKQVSKNSGKNGAGNNKRAAPADRPAGSSKPKLIANDLFQTLRSADPKLLDMVRVAAGLAPVSQPQSNSLPSR